MTGNDISASIAYDEARFEIDIPVVRGLDQHSREGLTATASSRLAMRAHAHVVDRKRASQLVVHCIDCRSCDEPVADIRLIRDDDDEQTRRFEGAHCRRHTGQETELFQRARRIWLAVMYRAAIDHTVTIEKYRAPLARIVR